MDSLAFRLSTYYKKLIHGIGFIPFIITLTLVFLGLILSIIEGSQSNEFSFQAFTQVDSVETARSILTGILSGMISLTVFGFSMMMVVVTQSSSNYSPKVVETLITNRSNQYILGVYLGTIIYTLMTMVLLDSENTTEGVPNLNLISNILLSILCVILFVKFINNISNSVRISTIAERIYLKTKIALVNVPKHNYNGNEIIDTDKWRSFPSIRSGYFQIIMTDKLRDILKSEDIVLQVVPLPGAYLTPRTPLFKLSKPDTKGKILERIYSCFMTYTGEDILENELYGFRQLREIAVKSLSPGINDPGVARICIDYLGDLLSKWILSEKNQIVADIHGKPRIILNKFEFRSLLELCFTPIKAYGKKDYTIILALLRTLYDVSLYDDSGELKCAINQQAKAIVEDAEETIFNFLERDLINEKIAKLNGCKYFTLPSLKEKLPSS